MRKALAVAVLILSAVIAFSCKLAEMAIVRAQGASALTIQGQGAHTTCQTPAAGLYLLCTATDGIWISNNGAAYFQLVIPAAQTAGVTSWNGQTGAVTYTAPTAPVTSVNGKTGAVSIAATSSTTTTLQ